jgi:hypothetical protein
VVVDPHLLENKANTIELPPIPANWHADIAEFGAVFRAIDLAPNKQFTMCELGCAWGCWMNISGVVAKRKGSKLLLIGVEGDQIFLNLAKMTLAINGIEEDEYKLYKGVASGKPGKALFPKTDQDHRAWGAEPIFNFSEDEIVNFPDPDIYDVLQQYTPENVFSEIDRVDLLHVDIQGGERSLIPDSISIINQKVAYLCIGTHSRQIEGELFDCLIDNGWKLEIERPAILQLNEKPVVIVDGVQGWRVS